MFSLKIIACAFLLVLVVAQDAPAQRLLADGVKELADQIVTATDGKARRIAIVAFRELDGKPTVLGVFLAESLTTRLFSARNLEIIERAMLDKVMAEMKLGASGAIDSKTAAQIGKLAGVDAIVTGSITDMTSSVAVNCRLIEVETGRVFAAAESRIVKDDDVRGILGRQMETVSQPQSATQPGRSVAPPSSQSASVGRFENDFLRVSVDSVGFSKSRAQASVTLMLENKTDQEQLLAYITSSASLTDAHATSWQIQSASGLPAVWSVNVRRDETATLAPGGRQTLILVFSASGGNTELTTADTVSVALQCWRYREGKSERVSIGFSRLPIGR